MNDHKLNKKTVLITGASGFVGTRLAERLSLGPNYHIRAMIHRLTGPGLARLARLPVTFFEGDLLNTDDVAKAVKNCDTVIHLAYGTSGDENQRKTVTVQGTENILQAAYTQKVRKVIYFSTAAVHGNNPAVPLVEESAPFEKNGDIYRSSKIQAEEVVWRYRKEKNLPVVILRPPIIYGPYSGYWTGRIAEEILDGAILPNGAKGAANLIYIDNLIDAVLLAMGNDAANGEAFFVVDDDNLTWRDVYEAYAGLIEDHPPLREMSMGEIEAIKSADEPKDLKSWFVKPLFLPSLIIKYAMKSPEIRFRMMEVPWLRYIKNRFPRKTLDHMKYGDGSTKINSNEFAESSKLKLPDPDLVDLYSSEARFSNKKIKEILGYQQEVSFDDAIKLIGSWLKYQRIIP